MYCVYLLYAVSHHRTYVGQTNNLQHRIILHNGDRVRSTKPNRPWTLLHSDEYPTRSEAMQREKWLKSSSGRKFIRTLVESNCISA